MWIVSLSVFWVMLKWQKMSKFQNLKTTLISGSYHAFLPSDCWEIHFWIITVLPNRKKRKKGKRKKLSGILTEENMTKWARQSKLLKFHLKVIRIILINISSTRASYRSLPKHRVQTPYWLSERQRDGSIYFTALITTTWTKQVTQWDEWIMQKQATTKRF